MISFGLSEEQEIAREAMRDYAKDRIRSQARDVDEEAEVPNEFLQEMWELGLTSTQISEEYGGGGEENSPIMNVILLEELGHGDVTLALAALSPSLFVKPIAEQGTDEQKAAYLPAFCGELFHAGSLALVEPGPVFDPAALRTVASKSGDTYVLSGSKSFVPLAADASHFLVVAAIEGGAGERGAFIVSRDASGLSVSEAERNLGLRALSTHGLTLEGVEVPASDRLGGEGGCDVQRIVNLSRTGLGALMVGLSRGVLEYAIPYAKDRVAFGEPIAQKQAIAFTLSDMRVEIDSMRLLVWKAASTLEEGAEATRSSHFARFYSAEQSMKIADNGVQVLGGHGFIRDHPVEMWYRNARTLGVLEGMASI